jgi:hypothetical protein
MSSHVAAARVQRSPPLRLLSPWPKVPRRTSLVQLRGAGAEPGRDGLHGATTHREPGPRALLEVGVAREFTLSCRWRTMGDCSGPIPANSPVLEFSSCCGVRGRFATMPVQNRLAGQPPSQGLRFGVRSGVPFGRRPCPGIPPRALLPEERGRCAGLHATRPPGVSPRSTGSEETTMRVAGAGGPWPSMPVPPGDFLTSTRGP